MTGPARKGLGILAVIVLVGGSLLHCPRHAAISSDESKPSSRITISPGITIESTPEILPVGRGCVVDSASPDPESPKTTLRIQYKGKIIEAAPEGISLDVLEVRREETASSRFTRLPMVNRLFRNIGIGTPAPNSKPRWIPVEEIQSVALERLIVEEPTFTGFEEPPAASP